MAWADRGGPLPRSLLAHIQTCPGCSAQVRRINEVHAGLTLLGTQPLPRRLFERANSKALRMMRRAARASEAARRLLQMKPSLTPWQKAQLQLARISLGAAAAVLILVVRTGTVCGLNLIQDETQTLADLHYQRHIDPNGEFLDPPNLA